MYINRGLPLPLRTKFDRAFSQNLFHGLTSKSGNGSSVEQTFEIAQSLPALISQLKIRSILDIPCGDLEWMSRLDLSDVKYIGADIAPSLVSHLKSQFPEKKFEVLDIVRNTLPLMDLVFCRDLFVHLSFRDIRSAIKNIKVSGSQYLASTTFTTRTINSDLPVFTRGVAWRTLNLELQPFNFPEPEFLIDEKCTEGNGLFFDKAMAIWRISNLP